MIKSLFTFLGIGFFFLVLSCNKKTEILESNEKPTEQMKPAYFFNYSTLEFQKDPKNLELLYVGIAQNVNYTLPLVPAELEMAYFVHPKQKIAPHLLEKDKDGKLKVVLEYFTFYPAEQFKQIKLKINERVYPLGSNQMNWESRDEYVYFQNVKQDYTDKKILIDLEELDKMSIYFVEIVLDETFFTGIDMQNEITFSIVSDQNPLDSTGFKTTKAAGTYIFPVDFDFDANKVDGNHPYWTGNLPADWEAAGVTFQ